MTPKKSAMKVVPILLGLLGLAACGGGGGGDGGGVQPPPPPTAVTYSVQLIDISIEDTRTNTAVDPAGLPIAGATATRN